MCSPNFIVQCLRTFQIWNLQKLTKTLSSPKPHCYKQNHNAEHGSLIYYKFTSEIESKRVQGHPRSLVPRTQATPPRPRPSALSQEIPKFTGVWDTPGYNVKNFVNSVQSIAFHGGAQMLFHVNLHPKAPCLAHSRC